MCIVESKEKKYTVTVRSIDRKGNESDTHSEPKQDPDHPSQEINNQKKEEELKRKESDFDQIKLDVRVIKEIKLDYEIKWENSYYVRIRFYYFISLIWIIN